VPASAISNTIAVTKSSVTSTTTTKSADASNFESAGEAGCDVVYSDGACKGNGRVGSVAGVGVWWGHNDSRCARSFYKLMNSSS
jgi:ribonuclease HI